MSARAAWRLESLGFTEVFRYTAGKADWLANGLPSEGTQANVPRAGDIARRNIPTCRLADRIGEVREQIKTAEQSVCLVVNDAGVVLGRLRGKALAAEPQTAAETVMESGPTTIRPNTPLELIARRISARKVGSIIVTDPDGKLIGILYRKDAARRLAESPAVTTGTDQHSGGTIS